MPPLPKQLLRVPFTGLDMRSDPKGAPVGRLSRLENRYPRRRTEGGFELEKAAGFTSLSRDIEGGGTLAAGAKLTVHGDELLMTDGFGVYSWTGAKWALRGRATSLAARRTTIDGIAGAFGTSAFKFDTDCAVAGGWAVIVISGQFVTTSYYVLDAETMVVLGRGTLASTGGRDRARVLVIGTTFYIVSVDGGSGGQGISAHTMAVGASPAVFGAATELATAAELPASDSLYRNDCEVDTVNSRLMLAFRNASSQLTVRSFSTALVQQATANYATENPDDCIGFLQHDYANGSGYLGVGTTANGVRLLRFSLSTMIVGDNTEVDAAVTTARNVTGFFDGTDAHVLYEVPGASASLSRVVHWDGASATNYGYLRSGKLVSRTFKVGSRWYNAIAYESTTQRNLYMAEWETNSFIQKGVSLCGYLMAGDGGGGSQEVGVLGAPGVVAADRLILPALGLLGTGEAQRYSLESFRLDFNETYLGAPVDYNGVLHIPGACPKVYDGQGVIEHGFLVVPEAPVSGTPSNGAGALTNSSTVQYLIVYARVDGTGRLWRSAAGPPLSVTLGASDDTVEVVAETLRVTAADPIFATTDYDPGTLSTRIEIYRTPDASPNFYLLDVVNNDASADTVSYTDLVSDADLKANEKLYVNEGNVRNLSPPAVLSFAAHKGRLFAACGDGGGAVWHTKKVSDGLASQFSDAYRVLIDSAGGAPTAMFSVETALVVAKRDRLYPLLGDGPTNDGNGAYAYPDALTAPAEVTGPRAFVALPDGVLLKTTGGMQLLSRALDVVQMEGVEDFDTLTVSGGVAQPSRKHAILSTSDGSRLVVWDWHLQQWHTRTGHSFVAVALWQGQVVGLLANGTVRVETAGSYADDGAAYTTLVEAAWINLSHGRLYKAMVRGDALATCTLSATMSRDLDATTETSPAKTIALTTASVPPWIFVPAWGRANELRMKLTESSTTAGVRLSEIALEVGIKPGAGKFATGRYMG